MICRFIAVRTLYLSTRPADEPSVYFGRRGPWLFLAPCTLMIDVSPRFRNPSREYRLMQPIDTVVEIPAVLRQYCEGNAKITVESVEHPRSVLERIESKYPKLYVCICNESGSLRPHVNLFVNSDLVRDDESLGRPLHPGDVVGIFQAVSGG